MNTLKLSTSWLTKTEALNDGEVGRLFRGMLQYASTGEAPDLKGGERVLWSEAREAIEKQLSISEKRAVAGSLGGVAKAGKLWQTVANDSKPKQTVANDSKEKTTPSDSPLKENRKKAISKDIAKERQLSPALEAAVREFKDMRTRMRKPMTELAIERMLHKLTTLASDEKTQIDIIHQSIDKGWTDLYALKRDRNTLKNYKETGVSHPELSTIAMDMGEL